MNEKEMYLQTAGREFQTTLKVIKAFPSDKLDFKPHEKSRTARDLVWNFVIEEKILDDVLNGEIQWGAIPKAPDSLKELLSTYESSHNEITNKLKNFSEKDLQATVKFPSGPKQMDDFRRIDMAWMMLMDMIHHRGQLSVYLRMAGGKVPSIYGPSADEPWM